MLTLAEIADAVWASRSGAALDGHEPEVRALLIEAAQRTESREVYVVQAENGDVVDVTWSRAYAERITDPNDPDIPLRSFVEETVWEGEVAE